MIVQKKFHLKKGRPLRIFVRRRNPDSKALHSILVELISFSIDDRSAKWSVKISDTAQEHVIHGERGKFPPLTRLWPGSWIGIHPLLTFANENDGPCPDFLFGVPEDSRVVVHKG